MRNIGIRTNSEREFILVQTILFQLKYEWCMFNTPLYKEYNKKHWKLGVHKMVEQNEKGQPDTHYRDNDVVIEMNSYNKINYSDWSGSTNYKSNYIIFYEFDEFKEKHSKILRKLKLQRILVNN